MTFEMKTITMRTSAPVSGDLPVQRPDRLLVSDNDGVIFLVDGGHPTSWPKNAAPADADAWVDLSGNGDVTWEVGAQIPSYSGNGFVLDGVTAGYTVRADAPAGFAASVWGDGDDDQYFLCCAYLKLPAAADWNPSTGLFPFYHVGAAGTLFSGPCMAMMGCLTSSGSKIIRAYRPKSTSVREQRDCVIPDDVCGTIVQVGFWNDADGCRLQVQNEDGVIANQTVSDSPGLNTSNFASQLTLLMMVSGYSAESTDGNANKYTFYRAFGENLRISGRDPVEVLAADWTRFASRGYT